MAVHGFSVLGQLGHWNYALLALLTLVEGPLATLVGATLAAGGVLNPWLVFIVATFSNMTADFLWYSLGRLGGQQRLKWLFKKAHIKETIVNQLTWQIQTHDVPLLFTAKITMSFSIPAFIAAGIAEVPGRRVLMALLPAEMLWTGPLTLTGYLFGQSVLRFQNTFTLIGIGGGIIFIGIIIRYILTHAWKPINEKTL